MKIRFYLLITAVLCWSTGYTQTTDVQLEVSKLLLTYGKVDVTLIKYRPGPEDMPRNAKYPNRVPAIAYKFKTQQYLNATNIRTLKFSEPVFGTAVVTEFPDRYTEKSFVCENPSSINLTCQQTLSLTFTRTSTIAFQKTVQNTSSMSANFKISIVPSVFDVGATIQVGQSLTTGTTSTDATSVNVQFSNNQSVTVPPGKAVLSTMKIWTVQHEIPFTCEVIVDADLSDNDKGLKLLSSILPETQRTFIVSGKLIANDCSSSKITQIDTELDKEQKTILKEINKWRKANEK